MGGGKPDQFSLSFYSDILPPVVCNKYGALGWVPTITLNPLILGNYQQQKYLC
ncbi:MAG: hypothetical protein Ct9H90mP22_5410 [Gammaproteobacteria bacterium]|nr:MAG: hypothetical protein Ct9H90mP22_5410 [Gammaproteobacteria bacterium]